MAQLILLNKPYGVTSQFSLGSHHNPNHQTLAAFVQDSTVYPAGRLDADSEGLLLLTNDGSLQHRISHPSQKLPKTYWVQVEGTPTAEAVKRLSRGVELKDGLTKPAKVAIIEPPKLWDRHPPVRKRAKIPTHWLSITITEGKNRQVRRMTAAVGLPTLRLVRVAIGHWQLGDLQPGQTQTETVHLPSSHSPRQSAKTKPNTRSNTKKATQPRKNARKHR